MKIIFFVVAFIFAGISWFSQQIDWEYAYILFYIGLFMTSWFICLIFLYQEENESSKKYTVVTPSNLIYLVAISIIIFMFRKYDIKEYETVKYSFYKVVAIGNAIQGALIVAFYKVRDIFYHA